MLLAEAKRMRPRAAMPPPHGMLFKGRHHAVRWEERPRLAGGLLRTVARATAR
jgi:hypothetical protein